ncbi:hypothetical protein GS610_08130 [Ruegeria sp. HKCCD6228]|uniref:hypothetical protein n=1 Tax=Ruegeria sp. HKCCD6228 TaxID=2683001 RepID=UPI0014929A8A|nr:hypothetical protein [Ruegeria sp. HKCCD6228]NOD97175.1 hypothetical protein [Ruegeria sp. HKCCD6228]
MRRRIRDLRRIAREFDRRVVVGKGNHIRLVDIHGKLPPITTPNTPSCWRSERRLLADLRNAGVRA